MIAGFLDYNNCQSMVIAVHLDVIESYREFLQVPKMILASYDYIL